MEQIFALEPALGGLDFQQGKYLILIGFINYAIIIIFFTIALIFLFVKKIKNPQFQMSTQTYKLQIMLFKTLIAQFCLISLSILAPIITIQAMFITKNQYGSLYANFALFPMAFHTTGNALSMFYFIRSYRLFLGECVVKLLKLLTMKSSRVDLHENQN
jgi:hypothetical protein